MCLRKCTQHVTRVWPHGVLSFSSLPSLVYLTVLDILSFIAEHRAMPQNKAALALFTCAGVLIFTALIALATQQRAQSSPAEQDLPWERDVDASQGRAVVTQAAERGSLLSGLKQRIFMRPGRDSSLRPTSSSDRRRGAPFITRATTTANVLGSCTNAPVATVYYGVSVVCAVPGSSAARQQLRKALPTWLASADIYEVIVVYLGTDSPAAHDVPALQDPRVREVFIAQVPESKLHVSDAIAVGLNMATSAFIIKLDVDTMISSSFLDAHPPYATCYYALDVRV